MIQNSKKYQELFKRICSELTASLNGALINQDFRKED